MLICRLNRLPNISVNKMMYRKGVRTKMRDPMVTKGFSAGLDAVTFRLYPSRRAPASFPSLETTGVNFTTWFMLLCVWFKRASIFCRLSDSLRGRSPYRGLPVRDTTRTCPARDHLFQFGLSLLAHDRIAPGFGVLRNYRDLSFIMIGRERDIMVEQVSKRSRAVPRLQA